MKLYHITAYDRERQSILRPRIPMETMYNEDVSTSRISLSTSKEGCLFGLAGKNINAGDIIRVYEVEVSSDDKSLMTPDYLYEKGLVDDALLSDEYWYTKPLWVTRYYEYELDMIEKRKYIIIPFCKKDDIRSFFEKEDIKCCENANILKFINYNLEEFQKNQLKEYFTVEIAPEERMTEIWKVMYKEDKPAEYERKYDEYSYIEKSNWRQVF